MICVKYKMVKYLRSQYWLGTYFLSEEQHCQVPPTIPF